MSKLIIISKDEKRYMDFDEVLIQFSGLIKKKASPWTIKYEYDDLFQAGSIGLWQAYKAYNAEDMPVGFAHYAAKIISRELLKYNQLNKPKSENKTSKIKQVISGDTVLTVGRNGEDLTLLGLIGDMDYHLEYTAERIALLKCISEMTKEDKVLIKEFLEKQKPSVLKNTYGLTIKGYYGRRYKMFDRLKEKLEVVRI